MFLESSLNELNNKLLALSEDRNCLEAEVIKLQSHLQHEQNQRNENSGHLKEVENRVEILARDLSQAQDREQRLLRENAEANSRKSELEKTKASLKLEAESWRSKHNQLASSSSGLNNVTTDDLNNVKGKNYDYFLERNKTLKLKALRGHNLSDLIIYLYYSENFAYSISLESKYD